VSGGGAAAGLAALADRSGLTVRAAGVQGRRARPLPGIRGAKTEADRRTAGGAEGLLGGSVFPKAVEVFCGLTGSNGMRGLTPCGPPDTVSGLGRADAGDGVPQGVTWDRACATPSANEARRSKVGRGRGPYGFLRKPREGALRALGRGTVGDPSWDDPRRTKRSEPLRRLGATLRQRFRSTRRGGLSPRRRQGMPSWYMVRGPDRGHMPYNLTHGRRSRATDTGFSHEHQS